MDKTNNNWIYFFTRIKEMTSKPLNKPSFVFFFFVSSLVSLSGIFYEIYKVFHCCSLPHTDENIISYDSLFTAFLTFILAITAPAGQLIILKNGNDKTISQFSFFFLILMGFATSVTYFFVTNVFFKISFFIFICAFALWMFWIANGEDNSFDDIDPDSTVGGNLNTKLSGDLEGFTK